MRFALPAAVALLAGCTQSDAQNERGQRAQRRSVSSSSSGLRFRSSRFLADGPSRSKSSEVRPQVNGVIRARNFAEGGYVRQGQPLYQIDPSLYRAAVNQAQANVAARPSNTRRRAGPRQPLQAAGRDGGHLQAGLHRRGRPGSSGPRRRGPEQRCAGHSTDQSPLHQLSRRRSAVASAVPSRRSARWLRPTRPTRSRSSSASTRSTSTFSSRAPT